MYRTQSRLIQWFFADDAHSWYGMGGKHWKRIRHSYYSVLSMKVKHTLISSDRMDDVFQQQSACSQLITFARFAPFASQLFVHFCWREKVGWISRPSWNCQRIQSLSRRLCLLFYHSDYMITYTQFTCFPYFILCNWVSCWSQQMY